MTTSIKDAFAACEDLARTHYENFPVASRLLPKERRPYVAAVYAFARTADDFADEGSAAPYERLRQLEEWEERLNAAYEGRPEGAVFIAIAETAARTGIPRELLADLLEAFRMDVTTRRYAEFATLLDYCTKSANPIGRLVLYIFGEASERTLALSDNICTGLQLANFWQDVSIDRAKGRIYIPLEDFDRFGYTETEFGKGTADGRFRDLMRFQVARTAEFFDAGAPLVSEVGRHLRLELAVTVRGGRAILEKIARVDFDVLSRRPALTAWDKLSLVTAAATRTMLWKPRPPT
jgi:squalene synthase HpnC